MSCLSQQADKKKTKKGAKDSAYIYVTLQNIRPAKTLVINIGEKAKIYLDGETILKEANKRLSDDSNRTSKIITSLDSMFSHSDTATIEFYRLYPLEYFASTELQNGSAKVFYKKQNSFVDMISHRQERYGGNADRFFYLPDKRPFFFVVELVGIIDKKTGFFSGSRYEEYVKEGEKIKSIREQ